MGHSEGARGHLNPYATAHVAHMQKMHWSHAICHTVMHIAQRIASSAMPSLYKRQCCNMHTNLCASACRLRI